MNNNLSEQAFNQLLLQIVGTKLIDSLNMIDSDSKSKIEKCIAITNEEYSYALSLQADCVPDSKRMIIQATKKIRKSQLIVDFSEININLKTISIYFINLNI